MKTQNYLFILAFTLAISFATAGTGKLYGFGPSDPRLLTIDPTTGATTYIGNGLPSELSAQQLSSIDTKGGIYYTIAYNVSNKHNHVIGISLKSGSLVSSVLIPFSTSTFVGVGEACDYNPNTGNVLVSGVDSIGGAHHILSVDPKTGHNRLIATIRDIEDVLGGATAFNPFSNTLWLQFGLKKGGIDNYGIDIDTGKLLFKVPDTLNLETLNFDPKTNIMYGVGLQVFNDTSYERVLLTLDNSGTIKRVGEIKGYYIIDASIAALNPDSRELYVIMQQAGKESLPFRLLTVDMNSGAVKQNPILCKEAAQCPWSMAYDPL